MTVIYQSVVMGTLVILSACAIVFPVLFLVQFHKFRMDFKKAFIEDEVQDEL